MHAVIAASVVVPFILSLAWFLASLWLSQRKDAELSARLPDTLSYKWGYFLGYSGVLGAAGVAVAVLAMMAAGMPRGWLLLLLAYTVAFGIASYGVLLRRRWGWLFHVPLSLNPGLWAFNSVYASNRWQEFARRP